jgi:hypothetical protein
MGRSNLHHVGCPHTCVDRLRALVRPTFPIQGAVAAEGYPATRTEKEQLARCTADSRKVRETPKHRCSLLAGAM